MDERLTIAKNIEMLIKTSGKSQVQIAQAAGVEETTISSYIAGRTIPSTLMVKKLCRILGCDYEDILGKQ